MRIIIALLLCTSFAKADGDILFQIGSSSVKQTVSDADLQRVVDHAVKAYNDPLASISSDEALQKMMNDIITSIFGNVVSGEKANAAKTAIDAVSPIDPVIKDLIGPSEPVIVITPTVK